MILDPHFARRLYLGHLAALLREKYRGPLVREGLALERAL